jgi:hypothetical protein
MKGIAAMLLLGLCLAVATGCGGSDPSSGSTSTSAPPAPREPREPGPKVAIPKGPPTKKLVKKDLKIGHGPPARRGDEVTIQYLGKLWTGEPYADSWRYPTAPSFTLGKGQLIVGFDRGIRGMRAGGRRRLLIPGRLDTFPKTPTTPASQAIVYIVYMLKVRPHR